MAMLNDFKAFIAKGNILDLAIAVIMGAAFGAIVKTFTDGIIMPVIGKLTGNIDFRYMFYDLSGKYNGITDPKLIDEAIKGGAPLIRYGQLINDVITFLIVAVVMFFLARYAVGLFKGLEAEAKAAPPPGEEVLLTEIRDLLKEKK
jgi:large conductance mechanosensitive channel